MRTNTNKYEQIPSVAVNKYKQHIIPTAVSTSNQVRLHQSSQIMTGAVASPPPKQPHLSSQQPIVAGKY